MSGVEFILGTVLGVVPLALEVYDRSDRVFEVFSTFRQYPRDVLLLDSRLSAQRTIFRNTAINLLDAITKDGTKVREVLRHRSPHMSKLDLTMAPVYRHRLDALEDSFAVCRQTAEQIRATLQRLYSQCDAFQEEVGNQRDEMSTSDWLKYVKKCFSLGLNKPHIVKAIDELRNLNQDFGSITEHITKALQKVLDEHINDPLPIQRSVRSLNILQKYHKIRHASEALYSTLQMRWMCSSHQCHSFDVLVLNGEPQNVARHVTCELSVTHDDSSFATKRPLRLEIEQDCDSDDEDDSDLVKQPAGKGIADLDQLAEVLNSSSARPEKTSPAARESKRTRFKEFFKTLRDDKQPGQQQSVPAPRPDVSPVKLASSMANLHVVSPPKPDMTPPKLRDLSLVDDFCKTIYEATSGCVDRSPLGSFSDTRAEWFCLPPILPEAQDNPPATSSVASLGGTSQTLDDLIGWIAEEPIRSLPRPLLFRLASDLAEGLMMFYSTPWLASITLGQNVRYFNTIEEPAGQLRGPYFTARIESKSTLIKGKMTARNLQASQTVMEFGEARNELLFRFGILLLEIGYGRSWSELRQSISRAQSPTTGGQANNNNNMSDYRAAEKLAYHLVNQLGPTYPRIVKKCLGCDFGLGETDLDNEDLQRRFVNDVVSGLQQLQEGMMKGGLGQMM